MNTSKLIGFVVPITIAFLLGAIPFGYIVGRLKGVDIRKHGSGNIGATNASRILGKKLGAITLLLDAAKGALASSLWRLSFFAPAGYLSSFNFPLCLGFAAILGHCFSPFLRFRGGKGVATALGVYIVSMPFFCLLSLAVFAIAYLTTGYVALGSILAASSLPIMLLAIPNNYPPYTLIFAFLSCVVIIIRHRENVARLLNGTEKKLQLRK
ncbi:MAG: glycerol-3-phosphate 1-O-acyltransferase PlsY [Deltaproteobacteria bacterium]|nr:glycerol-3-phosphate 1-O-acyltransferase PlsY [Deltaproteobacteria bacterium]